MSCERFRPAITDHAYGAVLDTRAAAHLAGCPACRTALDDERRLVESIDGELRQALSIRASSGFAAAVLARVDDRQSPTGAARLWWLGGAAVAALIVAAAVLSWPAPHDAPVPVAVVPAPAPVGEVTPQRADVAEVLAPPPPQTTDRTGAGARSRARVPPPRPMVATSPQDDLPVIVPDDQLRAIARLRELLRSGALDAATLPPPPTSAELAIEPLTVPDIAVPDLPGNTDLRSVGDRETR